MKRSEAEEKIKALGAQAKSSVVRDLSFLVTNDPGSGSSKNQKARELGIPVINEEQFLELLEHPERAPLFAKKSEISEGLHNMQPQPQGNRSKTLDGRNKRPTQQGELFES
jgi:BRCT domain type II-containing protein